MDDGLAGLFLRCALHGLRGGTLAIGPDNGLFRRKRGGLPAHGSVLGGLFRGLSRGLGSRRLAVRPGNRSLNRLDFLGETRPILGHGLMQLRSLVGRIAPAFGLDVFPAPGTK